MVAMHILLKYWVTSRCIIIYITIFCVYMRIYVRRSTHSSSPKSSASSGLRAWVAEFEFRGGEVRAARYGHPFRAPKWTSSSLEGPFQEIAEDEQGEGGRCIGSCFHKEIWLSLRRQWGANRDPLCLCFPLFSLSRFLCVFLPSSFLPLPSLYLFFLRTFLSFSYFFDLIFLDFSLRYYELSYYHRVVCPIDCNTVVCKNILMRVITET